MIATQVIFPDIAKAAKLNVEQFAVWVSNPPVFHMRRNRESNGEEGGTFLFLTEMRCSKGSACTNIASGGSVMHFILQNLGIDINGENYYKWYREYGNPDRMGKSPHHPIDWLVHCGGIEMSTMHICSIYQAAARNNEQYFYFHGLPRRTFDVVGYPLYIAEVIHDRG